MMNKMAYGHSSNPRPSYFITDSKGALKMRISFQNLPKDLIGLTKQQGLALRLGELLEAKVLKVGPQHALLNLKGQKILADIRSNLNVGDLIKVRVAGEIDNKILLKIANEAPSRQSSVDQVIQNLGHKSEQNTRSALAFLLKNQLPVSKEALQALITDQKNPLGQLLEKLISSTNQQDQQQPAQTQAKSAGGEPTQQLQQSQQPVQNTTPSQATQISQSTEQSGQTQSTQIPDNTQFETTQNQQSLENTKGMPKQEISHVSTQQQTEQNELTEQTKLTEPAKQTHSAQQAPVPQKGQRVSQTQQVTSPQVPQGEATPTSNTLEMQPGSTTLAKEKQQLTQLIQRLTQQPNQSQQTQEPRQGIQPDQTPMKQSTQPIKHQANLKQPTPSLNQQLEQLGLALNPAKKPGELVKQLKTFMQTFGFKPQESESEEKASVSKRLSSLLNSPLTDEQKQTVSKLFEKILGMKMRQREDGNLLHLEIPLLFNQPTTGLLQIRDDGEKLSPKSKDQPLSILFQLETEALGELKVMAVIQGQEIQCNFAANREEVRGLIRRSLSDLKGRFATLNYKVHQMQVLPWIEDEEIEEEPLSGQVDFRV